MIKRLVFLCAFLILSTSAFAQNINDFINKFRGVAQQGMAQATQFEWRKLPPNELSCIDQSLRQQNNSIDALINRGVMPSDLRLSQLRSNCRGQFAQAPQSSGGQSSPYVVDGLALYGQVRFDSQAYRQYQCNLSDKFPGFTWCHKEKTERTNRGEVTSSNSILHSRDGTSVYVNHYIEPAFFGPNDVQTEIDRLSAKFGERAREFRLPQRDGLPNAIIAIWGKIQLKQLDANEVATVAAGGGHEGILVSFRLSSTLSQNGRSCLPTHGWCWFFVGSGIPQ